MSSSGATSSTWSRLKSPGGAAFLSLASLVIGVALSVYGLVAERQPSLQVATLSASRVFDVHKSVGGLEVSYRGQDLRAAKKTLWSISISISNSGNAGIRLTDFDPRVPVTLSLANGSIVDRPVLSGAADYLLQTVRFKQEEASLTFEPFILDPQDGVRLALLVLGNEGEQPALSVTGKVAGVKSIELISIAAQDAAPSVWARITGADAWWIHVPRALIYAVAFVFGALGLGGLIALFVSPFTYWSGKRAAERRRMQLSSLKVTLAPGHELAHSELCSAYEKDGLDPLEQLLRIQRTLACRAELASKIRNSKLTSKEIRDLVKRRFTPYPGDGKALTRFTKASLIEIDADGGPRLSDALVALLPQFVSHLSVDVSRLAGHLDKYWSNVTVLAGPDDDMYEAQSHFVPY